jgi:antirestriction protein ArdC
MQLQNGRQRLELLIYVASAGTEQTTLDNSAAYIANWLDATSEHNDFIIKAALQTKEAVNYLIETYLIHKITGHRYST